MTRIIQNLADLKVYAKEIAIDLLSVPVVLFNGEMGTGKTTLIKLICEHLGVKDEMSSPTFSIVNEYLDGNGRSIYHFDLYRLEKLSEAVDIGIEEYLYSGNKCFIEWPELIETELPDQYVEISIKLVDENKRAITVSKHG